MYSKIKEQAKQVFLELISKARLSKGDIIVIGCSTSEIIGDAIGTHSSIDVAKSLYDGIFEAVDDTGIYLAAQCCEHLNRALVIERELAEKLNLEIVNAVPMPKAGGSSATTAYNRFNSPVVVEHIKAHAGVDIGGTLIGMHIRETAVPLRLSVDKIGEANIIAARTRPRFIGGERTNYNEDLL